MRCEILFRGKRFDDKTWIYGSLLEDDVIVTKGATDVDEDYIGFSDDWSSVDPATVGQYTGKTDKNGKKTFEDDIMEIVLPIKGNKPIVETSEVYFDNGCFCVNWGGGFNKHCRTRIDDFTPETTFEVIGNIHDNPELLEVSE